MKGKILTLATLGAISVSSLAVSPALAHDQLISVTPEAGTQLTSTPQEIVMEFSGEIMDVDGANQVKVVDAEGNSLTNGEPRIEGKTVTQKLTNDTSENDTYTVTWRVVSSDGHPIQNTFQYTVGNGATIASSETPSSETEKNSAEDESGSTTWIVLGCVCASLILLAIAIIGMRKSRRRPS